MAKSSDELNSYVKLIANGLFMVFIAGVIGKFLGNIMGNMNYRIARLEDKELLREAVENAK